MNTSGDDARPTQVTGNGMIFAVATIINGLTSRHPLAWIHGLGSASTLSFSRVARHPALQGTTSLLIDLPGHGQSEQLRHGTFAIEDQALGIASVLDQLTDRPVILIGHSMGGSIAIATTTIRPDLVSHLVVAEPNLDPGAGTTSVSLSIARQTEAAFVDHGYAALVQATARLARRGTTEAAAWLPLLRLADPTALHRSATSLLLDRSPTFRQQLAALMTPVTFVTGEHSIIPDYPGNAMPHLQGYVVPGAGHHLITANPDAFAHLLASIAGR